LDNFKRIFRWILPIYWAFLTYMLLKPGDDTSIEWMLFQGIDKIIHLSIFAFLAFCFLAAFPQIKFIILLQIILCYALLTEIFQDLLNWGRTMELGDVFADIIGFLLGFLFHKIFIKVFFKTI